MRWRSSTSLPRMAVVTQVLRWFSSTRLLTPSSAYKMSHADAVVDVSSRLYAFTGVGRLFAAGLQHGLPIAKAAAVRMPRAMASWLGRKA